MAGLIPKPNKIGDISSDQIKKLTEIISGTFGDLWDTETEYLKSGLQQRNRL